MHKYVAFLRAVNVGGHARVSMAEVKQAFMAAGCRNVVTYLQSGNVSFEVPSQAAAKVLREVPRRLGTLLKEEAKVLFRTVAELEEIVRRAPFTTAPAAADAKLYIVFLAESPPKKPPVSLQSAKEALEVVAMAEREAYLVSRPKANGGFGFPNGFIETELKVSATTRNWSTLTKMLEALRAESDTACKQKEERPMPSSPLVKKLGMKSGMKVLIVSPPSGYLESLAPLPEGVVMAEVAKAQYPFIQLFAKWKADIKKTAPNLLKHAAPGALVWISYPKKTARVESDLSREDVWDAMSGTGWRPVAQIALDEIWSALRFRPTEDVKKRPG